MLGGGMHTDAHIQCPVADQLGSDDDKHNYDKLKSATAKSHTDDFLWS